MMRNSLDVRVLIVEDSRPLSVIYENITRKLNTDVRTTGSGKEALELLETFAPEIMLLDLNLPDMSGMDILRTVNERKLSVSTIVMTANGSVDFAVEAMRLGAYDFLEKPIDPNRLKITLHNTIEKMELSVMVNDLNSNSEVKALGSFIGESPAMQEIYDRIRRVQNSKATVFITGESGTGKEVTAVTLHELNTQRKGKFIPINCAAIPHELMESEIFGHVRGAFTGAQSDHLGAVSLADGGTLFLDELCEMSLDLQSKFLRFLQSSTFRKVGSTKDEKVDVRIICATNKKPAEEVRAGRFREDLFYRLFVIHIHLPPLRERDYDVVLIARYFLKMFSDEESKNFESFSAKAEEFLVHYNWPGNVRQLQNIVHQAVVLNTGRVITKEMLVSETEMKAFSITDTPHAENFKNSVVGATSSSEGFFNAETVLTKPKSKNVFEVDLGKGILPLGDVEKMYIMSALKLNAGSISKTAKNLKVNPSTLYRKITRWQEDGSVVKTLDFHISDQKI